MGLKRNSFVLRLMMASSLFKSKFQVVPSGSAIIDFIKALLVSVLLSVRYMALEPATIL